MQYMRFLKLVVFLCFSMFNLVILARSYVVIIPSYNNIKWWQKNIESALELETIPGQIDYRIIYIDDCSTDGTGAAVEQYVKNWKLKTGSNLDIKIIHNEKRRGPMSNWYRAIHSCRDDEVVVSLDGDDCLAHKQVLLRLEQEYANGIWLTYGQYACWPSKELGHCALLIKDRLIRDQSFITSHLRTFYAGLFKKIKLIDFIDLDNKFFSMACDVAIMIPMLEMCNGKYTFISDVLYLYNTTNVISEATINAQLQVATGHRAQAKSKYSPISTYRADLVKSGDSLILDNANYGIDIIKSYTNSYIVIGFRTDNLTFDITPEDIAKNIEFLNQTKLDGIVIYENFRVINNGELICSINNHSNNVYAVRSENLVINHCKYIILKRETYINILEKYKNQGCDFDKIRAIIIPELVCKNDLCLYKIDM